MTRSPFLLSLLIAGSYWTARTTIVERMPVHETRPLTATELKAIAEYRKVPNIIPEKLNGWDIVYDTFDFKAVDNGETKRIRKEIPIKASRLRQDWWLRRDRFLGALRLLGLAACLIAAKSLGGFGMWGWHWRISPYGILLLLANMISWILPLRMVSGPRVFSEISNSTLWLLNAPVGFFEEACFRGLMFLGLAQRMSPARAALVSSIIFTVWHWGMQPSGAFPRIFLAGFVFCAAMHAGLGLPWIAFIHWHIDTLIMLLLRTDGYSTDLLGIPLCLGICAWAFWLLRRSAAPLPSGTP